MEFHLQHFGPCPPHWPKGGWSVYQINGDQIADRIVKDRDGKVTERHSWCGYLGIAETLAGAAKLIEQAEGGKVV